MVFVCWLSAALGGTSYAAIYKKLNLVLQTALLNLLSLLFKV
jgi:hypothetical protein